MMYSLNEIALLPSSYPTDITSRKQVDPYINGKLPIFVAPMTSVIDEYNFELFDNYKVIPILPRNIKNKKDYALITWTSFSLQEFINSFCFEMADNIMEDEIAQIPESGCYYVLIDIANGHIGKIYEAVKCAKRKYGEHIKIMIGNIANPLIYKYCCEAGVDYVRCNIGGGTVCSTSVLTSVHASHQYIIEGIKKLSCYYQPNRTKLIADGGINTIDKAIKCLALGYDYVMMGKCFAECEEACGETITMAEPDTSREGLQRNGWIQKTYRKYYGMASEQGQKDISGGVCKHPEGVETWIPVTTTIEKFINKFEAALRSSMSYTGAHNLEEFRTNTQYEIQSIEEFKSYYK